MAEQMATKQKILYAVLTSIGTSAVIYAGVLIVRKFRTRKWRLPPGDFGHPFIGSTIAFLKNSDQYIEDQVRRFGKIFFCSNIIATYFLESSPDAIRYYIRQQNAGLLCNVLPEHLGKLFGKDGILTHPSHTRVSVFRRAADRLFSKRSIARKFEIIDRTVAYHFQKWMNAGVPQESSPALHSLMFAIGIQFVVGDDIPLAEMDHFERIFRDWFYGLTAIIPLEIPGFTFYKAMQNRKLLLEVFQKSIDKRRLHPHPEGERDILDGLMEIIDEDGQLHSEADIKDTICSIAVASYITTASVTSRVIAILNDRPDCRERLREEIARSFDTTDLSSIRVTNGRQIDDLRYLEAFVKEVLRFNVVVSIFSKKTTEQLVYEGYDVPEGWNFGIPLRDVMMDEKYWTDPKTFNPDRFLTEKQVPHTFVPFGAGRRICLGRNLALFEIKYVLFLLVTRYNLEILSGVEMSRVFTIPFSNFTFVVRHQTD